MIVSIASFTAAGAALAERMAERLRAEGHTAAHDCLQRGALQSGGIHAWTSSSFRFSDALIFVGATGIAVRAVAPHLRSKATDPAVVSLDERGRYVVPLVSGHIGGANELARRIAGYCGGVAVISTATDLNGVFAVDSWAVRQGLRIANPEAIKAVSSRLLAGEEIVIASSLEIRGTPPDGVIVDSLYPAPEVRIGTGQAMRDGALLLVPPSLVLGIGCKKGTTAEAVEQLYQIVMQQFDILPLAVGAAASIDLKAQEPGLLAFCERHRLPVRFYSADELRAVQGDFSSSAFVQSVTGVDNICERAAVLGAQGKLLGPKNWLNGVTMAVARGQFPLCFDGE